MTNKKYFLRTKRILLLSSEFFEAKARSLGNKKKTTKPLRKTGVFLGKHLTPVGATSAQMPEAEEAEGLGSIAFSACRRSHVGHQAFRSLHLPLLFLGSTQVALTKPLWEHYADISLQ